MSPHTERIASAVSKALREDRNPNPEPHDMAHQQTPCPVHEQRIAVVEKVLDDHASRIAATEASLHRGELVVTGLSKDMQALAAQVAIACGVISRVGWLVFSAVIVAVLAVIVTVPKGLHP